MFQGSKCHVTGQVSKYHQLHFMPRLTLVLVRGGKVLIDVTRPLRFQRISKMMKEIIIIVSYMYYYACILFPGNKL